MPHKTPTPDTLYKQALDNLEAAITGVSTYAAVALPKRGNASVVEQKLRHAIADLHEARRLVEHAKSLCEDGRR